MTRRPMAYMTTALLALLAGCGSGNPTVAPATVGPASTVAPTTVAPTTTAAAQQSPDGAGAPGAEPFDLVLLADSGGWGVAERYAALASEALGRDVRVHDHTVGGATATRILWAVEQAWARDVAEAEIIVFYVHPGEGFDPPSMVTCLQALDAVTGDPDYSGPTWSPGQRWDPPVVTSPEDWQAYRDALDRIYAEIWKLRAGQPTILRAYGVWNPWIAPWRQVGIEAACSANQDVLDQVRREAAEANGATFVSLLDVFNGPGHDEDPIEKGWIEEDGMHANDAGAAAIAGALAAAGFGASRPPD